MNLSEALDAALPELPKTRLQHSRPPRLDPNLVVREDTMDGEPVFAIMQRDGANFSHLTPEQWRLAQFFDGNRSFEEIAAEVHAQTGSTIGVAEISAFADNLEEAHFFYKSPQEKNLALSQRLLTQRGRRAAGGAKFNIAHIPFSAWDPDRYLTWLDGKVGKYLYSPWSVLCMVLLFLFEVWVYVSKWNVIWPDVVRYYNFSEKGVPEIAEFWILFFCIGFFHESAHGLTCKHFGGQVHAMGFLFVYLTPAFYCDITEAWVSASKIQRLGAIIAGIWIELVMCGFAMIVWLNTGQGTWLHDFSYVLTMLTGIAVIFINFNPLIKLDGYYFLTEAIGIPTLKERSTAFLSAWFQKNILRLPVEAVVVPRRRAPFFALYAMVSGAYCYMLLLMVLRFGYNVASKWMAEFAIIPVAIVGFFMFRSRLRSLGGVLRRFWEHHLAGRRYLRPIPMCAAVLLLAILLAPIWRDQEDAWFVIEPTNLQVVHASLEGQVDKVMVRQGESVHAGQVLLRMSSTTSDSMRAGAVAKNSQAHFQAVEGAMRRGTVGTAAASEEGARMAMDLAGDARSSLVVKAPINGIVLTGHPEFLAGRYIGPGGPLLELADTGTRSVRVYILPAALERISADAEVALSFPGSFSMVRLRLAPPGGEAVELPPDLRGLQKYKGAQAPLFYRSRMPLPDSAGVPPLGLAGRAKIFGERHSLAFRFFRTASDLVHAHAW
jgi:putative peptide zinc metalloprotease protein